MLLEILKFLFTFISFKEDSPLANTVLQGSLHLINNMAIKNKASLYYQSKECRCEKLSYNLLDKHKGKKQIFDLKICMEDVCLTSS